MSAEIGEILLIRHLLIALALSFLIGLERERVKLHNKNQGFGGIRTFPLIGLLGGLSAYFAAFSPWLAGLLLFGFILFLAVAYFFAGHKQNSIGLTSELAALIVFVIGFLVGRDLYYVAVALTLAVLILLSLKNSLHLLAKKINPQELSSTIKFMVIAFIVLPLLPNVAYGPFSFFNPYVIWLMVVFVSGISFASYLGIKFIGVRRGIALSGFLGGLISSTALSLSYSHQSNKNMSIVNPYVFAVLMASSAMFFRILLEVSVLNNALLGVLIFPMVTMGGICLLGALYFLFKKDESVAIKTETMNLESPFQLKPALKFALFFALILLLTKASLFYFGDSGILATSVLSGLMDVDAITVSLSGLAHNSLEADTAALGIILAAITNTLVKGMFFVLFGNMKVAVRLFFVISFMLVGGLAVNSIL